MGEPELTAKSRGSLCAPPMRLWVKAAKPNGSSGFPLAFPSRLGELSCQKRPVVPKGWRWERFRATHTRPELPSSQPLLSARTTSESNACRSDEL